MLRITLLSCLILVVQASNNVTAEEQRAVKNLAIHAEAVEQSPQTLAVTEQERLDGIKSAFQKLPSDELLRLGVDIHDDFVAGSEEALTLQAAWDQRQKELKEVMEKQLKAADYMGQIAGDLKNASVSDEVVLVRLEELEELVADIDNARDFHTIGGWPALTSLLPGITERSLRVQSKAVHCIGTAVKNDYDFQLWVLETAGGESASKTDMSVLDVMLKGLEESSQQLTSGASLSKVTTLQLDELQRRVLYAVSAAVRGNLDVQASLPSGSGQLPSLARMLKRCVTSPKLSIAVKRKAWHMVSDLLDEMVYIRDDVVREIKAMQGDEVLPENIEEILSGLSPCGEMFVTPDLEWLVSAQEVAAEISSTCSLDIEGAKRDMGIDECVRATPATVRDIFVHVVKVKTLLLTEYGADLTGYDRNQLQKVKDIESHAGHRIDAYRGHSLLQDELY